MNKLGLWVTALCFTLGMCAAWALVIKVIFNAALSDLAHIHLTFTNAFGIMLLTRILK